MIREIAAALGGVVSALAALLFALLYLVVSNPNTLVSAQRNGFLPIAVTLPGASDQRLYYSGVIGVYPGILSAITLLLVAIATGFLVARFVGARLNGDNYLEE